MASYMQVFCPICRMEMNGMRAYGREANCCGMECFKEWEWRKTLAILGQKYRQQTVIGEGVAVPAAAQVVK